MNPTTHRGRWAILIALAGAGLAAVVYTIPPISSGRSFRCS